jgi:hypothetical protein
MIRSSAGIIPEFQGRILFTSLEMYRGHRLNTSFGGLLSTGKEEKTADRATTMEAEGP